MLNGKFLRRTVLACSCAGYSWYIKTSIDEYNDLIMKGRLPLDLSLGKYIMLKAVPFTGISHAAGLISDREIPSFFRKPIFSVYSWVFGCEISESDKSFDEYASMNEFFSRRLKKNVRPIGKEVLISPSDGKVVCYGSLELTEDDLYPGQVKGSKYSLKALLSDDTIYQDFKKSKKKIHYATIYLAPGNYHRFHSPCDWTIKNWIRRQGEKITVAPLIVSKISDIFSLNERFIFSGNWKYGPFAMVPVGSTNVGSIVITGKDGIKKYNEIDFKAAKGAELGYFKLGSTIVLVFAAPDTFKWNIPENGSIKMGQPLGDCVGI